MISYLIGKPLIHQDNLTILVNGVGYKVIVGSKVLQKANQKSFQDENIELYIFTHVKENALDLFGFETPQELSVFKLVLNVSGVGPAIALSLADAGPNKLIDGVQNANIAFFSAIPRVGKKLAQKIIIELTSKLGSLKELNLAPLSSQDQDIHDALLTLGFDEVSIEKALERLGGEEKELSLQESIQMGIKFLGKSGM